MLKSDAANLLPRLVLAVLLAIAGPAAAGAAKPPTGVEAQYWAGEFETRQAFRPKLLILASFWQEGGRWRGELNIPPDVGISGAWGVELLSVDVQPERIEFYQQHPNPAAAPNYYFIQRSPGGADSGTGSVSLAGGPPLKLNMWRVSEAEALDTMPRRPQEPVPPLPYQSRDIMVPNTRDGETTRVRGVLAVPPGPGPHPTVVMFSAAGQHDADHFEYSHKPFLVIADRLARAGIASMRIEDRAAKDPNFAFQTQVSTSQLAAEAIEALAWLVEQPMVDPGRLAFLGLNEGSSVAAEAARLLKSGQEIRAAVLLAPQGMTGVEQIRSEFATTMRQEGESDEFVERRTGAFIKPYQLLASGAESGVVIEALLEDMNQKHASRRQQLGEWQPEQRRELAKEQYAIINTPAFLELIRYDPAPALKSLRCPVFAVLGGKDSRFPIAINQPLIEAALADRGSAEARVRVLESGNHRLQPALGGMPDEMSQIETTIEEGVLGEIVAFLAGHLKPAPSPAQENK